MASYQLHIPEGERIEVGLQASEVTFSGVMKLFAKNEDPPPPPMPFWLLLPCEREPQPCIPLMRI
jgi:hypothetical protein